MGYEKPIKEVAKGDWVYLEAAGLVHATEVRHRGEEVEIDWDAYDSPVTRHLGAPETGTWSGLASDFPFIYVSEA